MSYPSLSNQEYLQLIQAYLDCHYQLSTELASICIQIGQPHPELDEILHPGTGWMYLTAVNPRSYRLTDRQNRQRLTQLEDYLQSTGIRYWPGVAKDPEREWPDEPGFLISAIMPGIVHLMNEVFEQNAILIGRPGQAARLLWLNQSFRPDLNQYYGQVIMDLA